MVRLKAICHVESIITLIIYAKMAEISCGTGTSRSRFSVKINWLFYN